MTQTFLALQVVLADPGDEHYPEQGQAIVDQGAGVIYVRREEWPAIRYRAIQCGQPYPSLKEMH